MEASDAGCELSCAKTTYFTNGTELSCSNDHTGDGVGIVGIEPTQPVTRINHGDRIVLRRGMSAPPENQAANATVIMSCTLPELFDAARVGEPIWFDDGKIGGVVEKVGKARVLVRITQDHMKAVKLRANKGINLPESILRLAAMTAKDIEDLSFMAQHADIVELSFANSAQDVELLQQSLASLGSRQPAIVLKIETRRGFENLPDMLLTAMRSPRCGVMIARGDLAVECGFERLAEVQEEILWICEAAHVPVIWATQVLETLAKEGRPSRAEITDAAMGLRAECVMLNKGPYVVSAVRVLDDILRRMHAHQAKKRSMLRELHLAHMLPAEPDAAADRVGHSVSSRNDGLAGGPGA